MFYCHCLLLRRVILFVLELRCLAEAALCPGLPCHRGWGKEPGAELPSGWRTAGAGELPDCPVCLKQILGCSAGFEPDPSMLKPEHPMNFIAHGESVQRVCKLGLSNSCSVHTPCYWSYNTSLCHPRASIPGSCDPAGLFAAPSPDLQFLFLLAAAVWDGHAAAGGQ